MQRVFSVILAVFALLAAPACDALACAPVAIGAPACACCENACPCCEGTSPNQPAPESTPTTTFSARGVAAELFPPPTVRDSWLMPRPAIRWRERDVAVAIPAAARVSVRVLLGVWLM